MDYSANFARHFARLIWLLRNDVTNVDEQKVLLRALVTLSKGNNVLLEAQDWRLFANDQIVPGALTGVHDLAAQMGGHGILKIKIAADVVASDALGLARIVASSTTPSDGGSAARKKLTELGAKGIEFVVPEPAAASSEAPTLVVATEPPKPKEAPTAPMSAARAAEAAFAKLLPPDPSKMSASDLLQTLDESSDVLVIAKALDDLALVAEHSVRSGKPNAVADVLHGIVARDSKLAEGDTKRAYAVVIRRLSKPAILRGVASLIPKKPEHRQDYYEVLARTDEDGAEAVIELITQAPTSEDRKALFEMLGVLDAAIPALKRMLGDSRWFVVRNAADLLGEMVAKDAEEELVGLLKHTDDRVRRSATNALLRLGTHDALRGIYDAVGDKSPEVRMQATAAISTRKDGKTANTLIRAIEDEQDVDVQLAMISALGKVATNDAVLKLIKMAEPEGRLFKKKTVNLRVAAVQALGEAKTPAALNALKELSSDKDREVREAAVRTLTQAGR